MREERFDPVVECGAGAGVSGPRQKIRSFTEEEAGAEDESGL